MDYKLYHLAEHLIAQGHDLVGIDNINDYYSTELKFSRLSNLGIDINNSHDFGIETISSTYHHKLIFIKLNLVDPFRKLINIFRHIIR